MAGELKTVHELLDDPGRCIHIGDRESDIYELFCPAQEVGTHFLVRTCIDRSLEMEIILLPTKWMRPSVKGAASHRGARRQR